VQGDPEMLSCFGGVRSRINGIVISYDMYQPAVVLRKILARPVMPVTTKIFLSSETKHPKAHRRNV
jgi:predicted HAD superfamily hydrolase